jgi:hypothetical protein
MKPNKLTLAIRAVMSAQALTGASLVLAASQAHAAVINVGGACTLVRAIVAANNDTTATRALQERTRTRHDHIASRSVQTLTAINNVAPYGSTGLPVIRSVISH